MEKSVAVITYENYYSRYYIDFKFHYCKFSKAIGQIIGNLFITKTRATYIITIIIIRLDRGLSTTIAASILIIIASIATIEGTTYESTDRFMMADSIMVFKVFQKQRWDLKIIIEYRFIARVGLVDSPVIDYFILLSVAYLNQLTANFIQDMNLELLNMCSCY